MTVSKDDLPSVADLLTTLGKRVDQNGDQVWATLHDWTKGPQRPAATGERGGGITGPDGEGPDEQAIRDRLEDARAARWWAEHVDLLSNLVGPLRRLHKLYDLATTEQVRRNVDGAFDPILAAEAAQAGYCASCWRLDQQLVEIQTDSQGRRYYRDWCRACGSFKAEHGILPPIELLRIKERRRNWTTAEVDAALDRARTPRAKKAS